MIELSLNRAVPAAPGDASRSLGAGELHIWRWTTADSQPAWLEQLDDSETERLRRLITLELREQFLAAHGGQRQVLAGYLQCDPSEVCFDYEPKGKPFIPGRPIEFNLSHSANENVLVVGKQPVGIDVECVRPVGNLQGLAAKHFTASEQLDVGALDDDAALGYFFQTWTRKEAVVKVTGLGLGASVSGLEVIGVTCDFCEFALPSQWNIALQACWLADLTVSEECYGAIATTAKPAAVRCFALSK